MEYVRFSEQLEQRQPDEEALSEQILASMARVNRLVFDQHRHAVRDAHAKSHGVLKGELTVYEGLAPELAQGLFAKEGVYGVMARLSTAPGNLQSDRIASPRGLALKVLGLLNGEGAGANQDFLLVNHPTIPFGTVAAYWQFQQAMEKAFGAPAEASQAAPPGITNFHILGETFHSMGALRFGDYVAKLSVAPLSEPVRRLTGAAVPEGDSGLRDSVVEFFGQQAAEYEVQAQLLTDAKRMPVEDAAVLWPEELSAHRAIGKITFPQQDAYGAVRRVYGDDVLSFSPWRCFEAHRPLGSINRIRLQAYEKSSEFRHRMNARERMEPRDVREMPD